LQFNKKEEMIMALLFKDGRNWVSSLNIGGMAYHMYIVVNSDVARTWSPQICEGDWQVAVTKVIAGFMYDNSNLNKKKGMDVYLMEGVTYMNNQLRAHFAATPPPVTGETWEEQFERLLKTLLLYVGPEGSPRVK
jgi:hypothetical protein